MDRDDRWHEEKLGALARHDQIKFPQLHGDELLYAYHRDEWFAAYSDWHDRGWADVLHLSLAEGKPLVIGRCHDNRARVHWDGLTGDAYANIPNACVTDGHVYYPAKRDDGRWVVVKDHRELDRSYAQIVGLSVNAGHMCLALRDKDAFYVVDDGVWSKPYDLVWDYGTLNGRSLFAARRGSDAYVVHGDREIGPWSGVWNLKTHRDKPLYSVCHNNRHEVFLGGCNWRAPAFVQDIACVNEKPFFSVKVDGYWAVVYEDIREGGFKRVSKLFNNHAKPLYEAVTEADGRGLYFGRERILDTHDETLAAKPMSGRVVAICRDNAVCRVYVGDEDRQTYAAAFSLRQKKRRFEFGAIQGSDILRVTRNFR